MNGSTHHWLGAHGDEEGHIHAFQPTPAEPITSDLAHQLEELEVPIPQPVELEDPEPVWLRPSGPGEVPPEIADAARAAGCTVLNSDSDLREYVEARGYALVPLTELNTVVRGTNESTTGGNPKDALGVKKPNLALVPPASSLYQSQAMMDGAAKYGAYNWRSNPVVAMIYISAALRHINAYLDGENIDPLSGVPHLGHGLACLGILADATETDNLIDDRPVPGKAGEMVRRFNDTQSFNK